MIAILPPHKNFGSLKIIETYVYFDGPKLFAVEAGTGQIFFAIWVDDSDGKDSYIFSPMTRDRFAATRSGAINLNVAFLKPEMGFVLRYTVVRREMVSIVEAVLAEQIDETLIPDPSRRLHLATQTMPTRFAQRDLRGRANSFRCEVLGLHLDFKGGTREEAPTGGLGKVLVGFQESIDAFGQLIEGGATLAGIIAPAILSATQTQVVYAGGGSFALEIAANTAVDLFNNSLVTDALIKLTNLLAAGNSFEELRDLLVEAKPRAASKYKKLLSALVTSQASLKLDWASPDSVRDREIALSYETAREALRTVEKITRELGETKRFEGYFDGIEIQRRTFFAISDVDGIESRGKILESAMEAAEHVTIKERYRITIKETIETTITGDERPRYELEAIDPI